MKINSWNVRGINASDKRKRIKRLVDDMKSDIVLLQETKLSQESYEKTLFKWSKWSSFHSPSIGASGGLAVLWNPLLIQGQLIHQHQNWQMVQISNFEISFLIINVYGPNSTQDKLKIWDALTQKIQSQQTQLIILGGDFNAVLNQNEKIGGISPPLRTIEDFTNFVDNNGLMDIPPSQGMYTWSNRRDGYAQIAVRLDRFLLSQEWKLQHFQITSDILPYPESDHYPITLSLTRVANINHYQGKSSFKFERMWLRHPHFLQHLKQWWVSAPFVPGSKMYQFAMKMKHIKKQIKQWNRDVFKNVFNQKEIVRVQLEDIHTDIIQNGITNDTYIKQKNLQNEWEELCGREEEYWRQKSRELWLQQGDKNTKYFHASA